jgi:predicted metalloendopeptidase
MRLVSPDRKEDWHLLPLSDLKTDQYLNNVNYIDHLKLKRELSYLKQDRDLKSWEEVSPLSVNAFYEHSNQFTMLQGILQYPFYDSSQSEIENMAGVGSVIGHELY